MRKFLISALMLLLLQANVFGFEATNVIRTGLERNFKAVNSVTISNTSLLFSSYEGDDRRELGILTGHDKFIASTTSSHFVEVSGDYISLSGAIERINNYKSVGYNAAIAFTPHSFSIYIGPYDDYASAYSVANSLSGTVIAPATRIMLSNGGACVAILESGVSISDSNGGFMNIGEGIYRGGIEFIIEGAGLTAVNVLTLEEYLYSVVPSEMPSSWPLDALKAQTVASRSYAMTRLSAHRDNGYHFCDRAHCQNYLGVNNESVSAIEAVNATTGIMAYYNGAPINAVYFSSSGGYTEDSENTWAETVPYLRAVNDSLETSGMAWERAYTLDQIQNLVGSGIGTVTRVYIGQASDSGRVQELVIQGSSANKILRKEEIRTFFSQTADGSLPSRNFSIQGSETISSPTQIFTTSSTNTAQNLLTDLHAISATGETFKLSGETSTISKDSSLVYKPFSNMTGGSSQGNTIVFIGTGWGHGVGMSQYGAKDMAEAGYDYVQILKHYYTDIEVR